MKNTSLRIGLCGVFFLLCCLPLSQAFAQRGFLRGYVITFEMDTLYGKVKDRSGGTFENLYRRIKFRPEKGRRRRLGPDEIVGYNRGGAMFKSMWLDVQTNFFRENYTCIPGNGQLQFVKVVAEGYLSLLHVEWIDPDNSSTEFIPLFKRMDETRLVRVTQGVFGLKRKKLAAYFQDCPELVAKIQGREIRDPVEIVNFYNRWYSGR